MKIRILTLLVTFSALLTLIVPAMTLALESPISILATTSLPEIDGIKDSSYTKVLDFTPANAALVYGQGGDFTVGDLTGTNNLNVNAQGLSAKAYFTWDNNNLYYFSECTDNSIQTVASTSFSHLATDNRLFIKNGGIIKNINLVNTSNGLIAVSGGQTISKVTSKIKLDANSYTMEAKIPLTELGISTLKTADELKVNLAVTSSKSATEVNSVIYSPHNWFGTTDDYFEPIKLSGTPALSLKVITAYSVEPTIDGVKDSSYSKVLDFTPANAGLVYGQGGDFTTGDLTGSNNVQVNAQGLSAKAYFTWDNNNLYYFSECTDNSIQAVTSIGLAHLATDNRLFVKNGSAIKNINLVNTSNGLIAVSGGQTISKVTSKIKLDANSYTMEAKIPLTELGISTLITADELKVNLAVTSSKSTTEVNSVIYSPYNWFGTTEAYFEPIILSGTPVLNTKIISAYTVKPSVDGIRDSSYLKVLDYTPANAGLVYGQGGDFTTGDLTGSNNVKVNAQGLSAKAYFTWDSNNLYYFSECTDNSIQAVASIGLAHLSTDNRLFIKNGATIKNINFVNTINGLVAISGGQAVSKITSKIKLAGKSYTIEARIPWSAIGIASPKTGSQLMINMAQTSSKSTKVVNSVIYSPYNWFGTTDAYFEKAVLKGYPAVTDPLEDIKNPVKASAGTIKIDGFREDFYNSIFDFSPSNAGLVYGQGGDFKVGDLTGTNNSKVAAQKLTAKGYFTWDKGFLYFISECTDNSIIKVSNINQHYLATDNRLYIKNKNEVKEIRFIITEEGVLVINSIESGVAAIDGITAAYKTDGTKYSIEAKIPWSTIGIAPPETGSQLLINLVITSSKSLDSVNSVIYSKYNWFGVADSYFETINFVGNPQNPKTSDTQTSTLIVMILLSISIIIVWGRKNRKRVRIQS